MPNDDDAVAVAFLSFFLYLARAIPMPLIRILLIGSVPVRWRAIRDYSSTWYGRRSAISDYSLQTGSSDSCPVTNLELEAPPF